MFTGIVEELGEVVGLDDLRRRGAGWPCAARSSPPTPRHGDSIAVNGVCLTVVDVDGGVFTADVMRETLRPLLARRAAPPGDPVNLERAAGAGHPARRPHRAGPRRRGRRDAVAGEPGRAVGDRHVSAARRAGPVRGGEGLDHRRRGVADRDAVGEDAFAVGLIPTTLKLTTLGRKGVGDPVNLEVDVIAKYVEAAGCGDGTDADLARPGAGGTACGAAWLLGDEQVRRWFGGAWSGDRRQRLRPRLGTARPCAGWSGPGRSG